MQTHDKAKCYDKDGFLIQSGVTVVIDEDRVLIGAATHPIDDVTIDEENRTIESPNGWTVKY